MDVYVYVYICIYLYVCVCICVCTYVWGFFIGITSFILERGHVDNEVKECDTLDRTLLIFGAWCLDNSI